MEVGGAGMGYAHGTKWTDSKVEEGILRVVDSLGIKHFPTHSEIQKFYGDHKLTCKISKTGGTRYWAEKLGLPIKRCESEFGNDFELLAIEQIKERTGLNSHQTKPRYPYDILTNDNIKVDVKVSYPFTNKDGSTSNNFNLEKTEPTCDLFVLYCLKKDGSINKTLIIPSCVLKGQNQVGVGLLSKWDIFDGRWDYFSYYKRVYDYLLDDIEFPNRRRSKKINW